MRTKNNLLGANITTITAQVQMNNQQRLQANQEQEEPAKPAPIVKEGPIKIELPVFKPKNECNVIKIIQKEWEREVDRLNQKKLGKKQLNNNEKSIV